MAASSRSEGYDRFATFLSRYPQFAIFSHFGALSMKCLLYKQAEILHLETELEYLSNLATSDPDGARPRREWYYFAKFARPKRGPTLGTGESERIAREVAQLS
jgi:hypothetical protein